jgi:hypothetical protein
VLLYKCRSIGELRSQARYLKHLNLKAKDIPTNAAWYPVLSHTPIRRETKRKLEFPMFPVNKTLSLIDEFERYFRAKQGRGPDVGDRYKPASL